MTDIGICDEMNISLYTFCNMLSARILYKDEQSHIILKIVRVFNFPILIFLVTWGYTQTGEGAAAQDMIPKSRVDPIFQIAIDFSSLFSILGQMSQLYIL